MRKCLVFISTWALFATFLITLAPQQASAATTLTTCTSLKSSVQYLAREGKCNERIYESATWYLSESVPLGTPGSKRISINTCQSKTRADLILLRTKCNPKTQITTTWYRPLGPPAAPSIVTITAGLLGTATVTTKAPADNGGARITAFTLSADPSNTHDKIVRVNSTYKANTSGNIKIEGLNPGVTYTFTLIAHNAVGASASSIVSAPFLAPTVPAAPAITAVITTGTNSALVTYTAPTFDGGSQIISYTATSIPGGVQTTAYRSSSGTIEATGLISSTSYTFTVVANNMAGSSLPSTASASITTLTPPPPAPATTVEAPTPTPTLAAPAFTLSASSETRTANIVATGFTISSTGGLIASFAINATPAGMSFSTSTGALTGAPTSVATATTYTITATNATGSTTATFALTVLAPLSTDATLTTASTIKGQAILLLGTPSATLASATAGSVPISTTQAADTSNTGSYITAFSKTNSGATISRIVKYASGASYTGFATDTVYNGTAAITAGDFFIVKVIAVDESAILYYNIIAKFLPTFSTWANLSKPALAHDFALSAPVVTGSLAGTFAYSSATTGVITISGSTAHVVAAGTSVITATFTPTNTAAYSSATTTMTITVTAGDYTVGMDGPGGGKVFYVSASTFLCGATQTAYCKFLESAPSGWNSTASDPQKLWAQLGPPDYRSVDVVAITNDATAFNDASGIGLGYQNSVAIVAQGNGTTTAAGSARAYSGGTLSDWYLPTTAELNLLCQWSRGVTQNVATVCTGGTLNSATFGAQSAGFSVADYWSSSEKASNIGWFQYLSNGVQYSSGSKGSSFAIRPIRAFASLLPSFTLSSSSETKTVNTGTAGFTVTSTGSPVTSYAITPSPAPMSFNTTTGRLNGWTGTVAGVTTFTVTATNDSGSATQTFVLTVTPGPANKVAVSRASVGTQTGSAFSLQPQITVQDGYGNTVTTSSAVVTATTSGGGTIVGTETATAVSGVATFVNLGISGTVGTSYTVTYTADGLTVAKQIIKVTDYVIGSTGPGGGKIFYIATAAFSCGADGTSWCTFLEAAPSAWNTGTDPSRTFAQSSPVNYQSTLVNNPTSPQTATATAIGSGYSNTRAIVLQGNTNTSTSAAALSDSYTVTIGGVVFDDWYLPSRLELTQLHSQRTVLTGFGSHNYWSSSAYNAFGVWIRDFSGTFEGGLDKSNTAYVRPIRSF